MRPRDVDVLVVEDGVADADLMLRALHSQASDITTALLTTGAAALEYLAGHRPKILLLDLDLPDGGGIEVLRKVRGDLRLQSMPVILLIASTNLLQRQEADRLGVNAHIRKTTDLLELGDRLSVFRHLLIPSHLRS